MIQINVLGSLQYLNCSFSVSLMLTSMETVLYSVVSMELLGINAIVALKISRVETF